LSAGGLIDNNSIASQNHFGELESKIYETTIAPGSGASIEVVFPEEEKISWPRWDSSYIKFVLDS
jgi:hypothetical protein